MPKLHSKQAKKALQQVIAAFGRRCYICGRTDRPLELDHRNGDPTFNPMDGSNWGAACGPCNRAKGPLRGPGKRGIRMRGLLAAIIPGTNHREGSLESNGEGERKGEGEYEGVTVRMMSAEMKKNMECEPRFREYAVRVVRQLGEISMSDLVYAGSEYAGCVDQTGRRYLAKMLSLAGLLELFVSPAGVKMVRMKAQSTPAAAPPPVKPAPTNGKAASPAKPDANRSILQSPGGNR